MRILGRVGGGLVYDFEMKFDPLEYADKGRKIPGIEGEKWWWGVGEGQKY